MNTDRIKAALAETVTHFISVIASLKSENLALKAQLAETHSALVAAEIRENDLLNQYCKK